MNKTVERTVLICDRCESDTYINRIPYVRYRVNLGQDMDWETHYIDLCDNCILKFIEKENLSEKIKKFSKGE